MTPRPSQVPQAPFELKLKKPASAPVSRAKIFRTVSMIPRYVAGVDRPEIPIDDWSTTTASSWPAVNSATRVLFPDPATPVTAVSTPAGNRTVTSRRLCRSAPLTHRSPTGRRTSPLTAVRVRRQRPVSVPDAASSPGVPSNTTVPPPVPAPGPMSTTWSASAITSGSCSTTSTVLPLSRSRSSRSPRRPTSRGCRPTLGSSKMYVIPLRLEPRCRTVFSRCPSPPLSVAVSRSRLR